MLAIMLLIPLSLILNILITFTVTLAIWQDHAAMTEVYGPDTPARRILACLYAAIGIVSLYALIQLPLGNSETTRTIVLTLFPLQILYKLLTAAALWIAHPVVLVNLAVVVLLAVTLMIGV